MKHLKIVAILAACMIVSACGLKADLYLPQPTEAPTQSVEYFEDSSVATQGTAQ